MWADGEIWGDTPHLGADAGHPSSLPHVPRRAGDRRQRRRLRRREGRRRCGDSRAVLSAAVFSSLLPLCCLSAPLCSSLLLSAPLGSPRLLSAPSRLLSAPLGSPRLLSAPLGCLVCGGAVKRLALLHRLDRVEAVAAKPCERTDRSAEREHVAAVQRLRSVSRACRGHVVDMSRAGPARVADVSRRGRRRVSEVSRTCLGVVEGVLELGRLSYPRSVSCLGHVSDMSRTCLGRVSDVSDMSRTCLGRCRGGERANCARRPFEEGEEVLYLGYISAISRLYLAARSKRERRPFRRRAGGAAQYSPRTRCDASRSSACGGRIREGSRRGVEGTARGAP